MLYLVLEYNNKIGHYWPEEKNTIGAGHLAFFLTDDVGCHAIKFYKEWLNNPEDTEGGGNYSHLEKRDNKVIISFEYDWFHETPGAETLELAIDQLNYILDRWQEACEKKPNRIIITLNDNDNITVDFED